MNSTPHRSRLSSNTPLQIARRRALPIATAAAALSLGGCGILDMGAFFGQHTQTAAQPMTPEQIAADKKVKEYQADIQAALDKVDREKLLATTQPASRPAPATMPEQVLLATSTSSEPAPTPPTAMALTAPAPMPGPDYKIQTTANRATAFSVASLGAGSPPGLESPTTSVLGATLAESAKTTLSLPPTPNASAMAAMSTSVTPHTDIDTTTASTPTEASLDGALEILRKNIAEHPTLNTALALALLDGGKGGEAFKKLPESDQKVLADLLTALEAMKTPSARGATLAQRAAPLVDAAKHWQEDADLTLPRIVLATRVDSFGVFTPISGTFEQGKRHTVIIYCEVANFASQKGADGWYTTKLSQQESLITEDGLLVWRPNAEQIEDRSLNQRHDFYLVKKLTLPESLAAGKYTLRMSVTDKATNKISLVSMPVEVVVK